MRTAVLVTGSVWADVPAKLRDEASVLITDSRDVTEYQHQGVATEYLAAPSRFPERYDRDETLAYLVRRLAVLRVKWRLGRVYISGAGAAALADAWLSDPEGPRPGLIVPFSASR